MADYCCGFMRDVLYAIHKMSTPKKIYDVLFAFVPIYALDLCSTTEILKWQF